MGNSDSKPDPSPTPETPEAAQRRAKTEALIRAESELLEKMRIESFVFMSGYGYPSLLAGTSHAVGASAAVSALSRFLVSPLDLIKTRFQVQPDDPKAGIRPKYRTFVFSFSDIRSQEGIAGGIMRGSFIGALRASAQAAVRCAAFRRIIDATGGYDAAMLPLHAAAAGALSAAAVHPLAVLETRKMALLSPSRSRAPKIPLDGVLQMRGLLPAMAHAALIDAVSLKVYEKVKQIKFMTRWKDHNHNVEEVEFEVSDFATAAASATAVGTIVAHPLDVIRTRMLAATVASVASVSDRREAPAMLLARSPTDPTTRFATLMAIELWKREGLAGYLRGFSATAIRTVPHTLVSIFMVERLHGFLQWYDRRGAPN